MVRKMNKTKTYIRPCPVRLIGCDLRNEELGGLRALYPSAIAADLDANIWLVICRCGTEFTCHADKLLKHDVESCGQCVENGNIQSEIAYIEQPDCDDLLQFGE